MSIPLFLSSQTSLSKIIIILLVSETLQLSSGINNGFQNCSNLYNCGTMRRIGYPFYGGSRPNYCGIPDFELNCLNDHETLIRIDNLEYFVLVIDESVPRMTLARTDLFTNSCLASNTTTLTKFTTSSTNVRNINIFYGCPSEGLNEGMVRANITCPFGGGDGDRVFFADEFVTGTGGCKYSIVVPISLGAYNDLWDGKIALEAALKQGFDVEYNASLAACAACEASGGRCGSDLVYNFTCFCLDQSYPSLCPHRGKGHRLKLIIEVATAATGILICLLICYCIYAKSSNASVLRFLRKFNAEEAMIKQLGSSIPTRYSYSDIKKMTNSFRDKLGRGGHGDVYKGYLSDSRPVAVKLLKYNKGHGEEFLNELASINGTSHVNVVSLLGFCLDSEKSALIYEFMPNGSLEKYIGRESHIQLGVEELYKIAIGVARGLEYLHVGYKSRMLHFDIKPHNILLDEDFCPKISDFGLATFCHKRESFLSKLQARGTVGYIAPEFFSPNIGRVSCKSDVYSYGMMVLDMVGARNKPTSTATCHSSDAYFPNWVYQRLTCNENRNLQADTMSSEDETERKMILVGLWCIQTDPLRRPTIRKVIEMLEGSLKCLEVPPKPVLYRPSVGKSASLPTTSMASETILSFSSTSPV